MSGVDVSIRLENLGAVREVLDRLSGQQARVAYAAALNDVGFQVRRAMQAEMGKVFDRPTSYITKSPRVHMATPDKLSVRVEPTYMGGKGVDPQKILQAQEFGGARRDKRSEAALRRVGILPSGYQTAIPTDPYPGSDDGKGNVRGPFLTQLITYFQAAGDQGYRSNMSDKRKAKLRNQQDIGSIAARKVYKTTLGVRYFISYGRMRGQHLKPGIWAAKGVHDVDVKPVLMFVRAARYTPRLSMERVAKAADLQDYLDKRLRFRIREAAGL